MQINKINGYTNFKSTNTNKNYVNIPKLSGQLTCGFVGAAILTGFLHKPKLHNASAILCAAAIITHVLSLKPRTNQKSQLG